MKKTVFVITAILIFVTALVGCSDSSKTATPDTVSSENTESIKATTQSVIVSKNVADATQKPSEENNGTAKTQSDEQYKEVESEADSREADEINVTEINIENEPPEQKVTEQRAIYIYIGNKKLKADLEENSSANYLLELLTSGDIYYSADDYNDFEKVGNIGFSIPTNNSSISTEPGDVILYQGNQLCLYYGYNSWNFTKLGHIYGYSESELRSALKAGYGETDIRLSLK